MAKYDQAERFHAGTLTDGWRWFGSHPDKKNGAEGWTFRVWAPTLRASASWATSTTGRTASIP